MYDIRHRVGLHAPIEVVFDAVGSREGLCNGGPKTSPDQRSPEASSPSGSAAPRRQRPWR